MFAELQRALILKKSTPNEINIVQLSEGAADGDNIHCMVFTRLFNNI